MFPDGLQGNPFLTIPHAIWASAYTSPPQMDIVLIKKALKKELRLLETNIERAFGPR